MFSVPASRLRRDPELLVGAVVAHPNLGVLAQVSTVEVLSDSVALVFADDSSIVLSLEDGGAESVSVHSL